MDEDVLVYKPLGGEDFAKRASYDIELSRNVSEWPIEVIRHFAQAHPYAYVDQAANVEFQKVDEKEGHAFGAIIITSPYRVQGYEARERLEQEPGKIAVPVLIEKFQLKPFDVFVVGDKVLPLTEKRFMEAADSNQIASGLDPYAQASPLFIDKMMPPTVGYLGNMYGNHAFSSQEPSQKTSSANPQHENSIVHEIRGTIQKADYDEFQRCCHDPRILSNFASNKTLRVVKELFGTKPTTGDDYVDFIERAVPVHLIKVKGLSSGRFRVTEYSDYFYKPVTKEMAVDELKAKYGNLEPRVAELAFKGEGVLLESPDRKTVNALILEDMEVTGTEDAKSGHYVVATKGGGFVEGQVFGDVRDYNKNPLELRLFATGSAWSMCDSIVGHRMGDLYDGLTTGALEAGVEGTFVGLEEDGKGGEQGFVLLPFKITNLSKLGDQWVVQALGQGLEHLTFVIMPGISKYNSLTGISSVDLGTLSGGNIYYVPMSFKFLALGKKIQLEHNLHEINRFTKRKLLEGIHGSIYLNGDHRGLDRTLRVACDHQEGTYRLVGKVLETLRRDAYLDSVPALEAQLILANLGCSLDDAAHILSRAEEEEEIGVTNLRPAKDVVEKGQIYDKNWVEIARAVRKNLVKEASAMSDPASVDALLSLNFVNETNLTNFLQNLPKFQDVESKLAEALLYVRLGLKNRVPEQAVYSAMVNLNEVNENLEYLDSLLRQTSSMNDAQQSRGAQPSEHR